MAKIRVYELAKKLNINKEDLKQELKNIGVNIKSHMNSLDEEVVKKLEASLKNKADATLEKEKIEKTNKKNKKGIDANEELEIIEIPANLTVKELSIKIGKNVNEILKLLMLEGIIASINYMINFEEAAMIAEKYNFITELEEEVDLLEKEFENVDNSKGVLENRPPVVVVMGHVDHGKTSLLDYIRKSKVTKGEAGGITQHIGAYTVKNNGKPITFLDTPGHEAFTAMRLRGAQTTDIAILVVAADDGVMPQTIEAINHAKAADVEIIIAINKIDKPGSDPERVKQELTEHELLVEEWGGTIISVPVSAHTGEGIETLLEMVILAAEMKELRAAKNVKATGIIIESSLDKGRGTVATVLIKNGTLKLGDPVVVGNAYGRVRAMINDKGERVISAGPSIPVEILGLSKVPKAGDSFYVAKNEKHARQLSESVEAKGRVDMVNASQKRVSLDDLFDKIQQGEIKDLNIVIKGDVQGSVEALRTSLEKLSNDEVRVRILHGGVGSITETDIMLASASNALIIGFNVSPASQALATIEKENVDIRLYNVIYDAIDNIKRAMTGMLDPIFEEKIIGSAEVRQVFKASGVGTIGGSFVITGKIIRNCGVRIIRDKKVIHEGKLSALKRFKDDVKEVVKGYDCGLLIEKYNDIKEGDIVEGFVMEEIKR